MQRDREMRRRGPSTSNFEPIIRLAWFPLVGMDTKPNHVATSASLATVRQLRNVLVTPSVESK